MVDDPTQIPIKLKRLPQLSTAEEVARSTHIPEMRIVELAESGYLPHSIVDGELRFRESLVQHWLRENAYKEHPGRPMVPRPMVCPIRMKEPDDSLPPSVLHKIPVQECQIGNGIASGIYFLVSGDDVVYVGQAKTVLYRIIDHIAQGRKEFDRIFYLPLPKSELNASEKEWAEALRPKYNIAKSGKLCW